MAGEADRQWQENRFGAMKGDGQVTRSFKTARGTVEVGMTLDQVRRMVDQRNVIGPRVRLAQDAYLETYQFGLKLYNVRFDDANVVRDIVYGEPDCGSEHLSASVRLTYDEGVCRRLSKQALRPPP